MQNEITGIRRQFRIISLISLIQLNYVNTEPIQRKCNGQSK